MPVAAVQCSNEKTKQKNTQQQQQQQKTDQFANSIQYSKMINIAFFKWA